MNLVDIPKDVLLLVNKNLDLVSRSQLAQVCTLTSDLRGRTRGRIDTTTKSIREGHYSLFPNNLKHAFHSACSLDVLLWTLEKGYKPTELELIRTSSRAAKRGDVSVLEWCESQGVVISHRRSLDALMYGRVNVLDWLLLRGIKPLESWIGAPIIRGRIESVKWLLANGYEILEGHLYNAIWSGNLEISKLLISDDITDAIDVAIDCDKVNIVEWLLTQGKIPTFLCPRSVKMLDLLLSYNIRPDSDVLDVCSHTSVPLVKRLLEMGYEFNRPPDYNISIEILELYPRNLVDLREIFHLGCQYANFDLMDWCMSNGFDTSTFSLDAVVMYLNPVVVSYAHSLGCTELNKPEKVENTKIINLLKSKGYKF